MTIAQELTPYRSEWPNDFRTLAVMLREALGPVAVRIDHIGSTSVPGLMAKDRIDIQVTVADLSAETDARLKNALTALGYRLHSPISHDHPPPGDTSPPEAWQKRYFLPPVEQRPTNLHVRVAGRPNQRYALLFRDYLRTHSSAASAYASLKRTLADYVGENRDAYVDIKDPVCDVIMSAAEDWATRTGWTPGPSDA